MRSFLEKYKPEKAYVVNLNLEKRERVYTTMVHFLPFYKIFTEEF